ncbi:MAG: hypothetical protein U0136_07520 [Bdellovibrionota bacterium]
MQRSKLLVVVFVTLVALGLLAGVMLTRRDNHLSFQDLKAKVSSQWTILDSHFAGRNAPVLVVFADAHYREIESLNQARISSLHEMYPLDIVLLENIIGSPDDPKHIAMNEAVAKSIEIDRTKILERPKGKGAQELVSPPHSALYTALFKDRRFTVFGYEDPALFQGIAPSSVSEEILDNYIDIVMQGYTPIKHGGKMTEDALTLIKVGEVLNRYAPGYPLFDTEMLANKKDGTYLLGKEDAPYVGELAVMHRLWTMEHAIYPRNRAVVERSLSRMAQDGFKYGAMVIGLDHLKVHEPIPGKTIQDNLRDNGVSFIVVGLPEAP